MDVRFNLDLYAYYEYQTLVYRIWINDNLYNEREFWTDCLSNYIEEEMFADLKPGEHTLTLEKISPSFGKIWTEKLVLNFNNFEKVLDFPINPQDKQIIKFTIE